MKIVIDGVIFGLQRAGGISRLWADLLRAYDGNPELDVTVLLPTNQNLEWQATRPHLKRIRVIKRARFRWNQRSPLRDALYLTWVASLLRPDVWHQSYYVGFPLLFGGKRVTTFHDMIPERMGCSVPYDLRMKYQAVKCSQGVAVISHHTERDLHHFWPEFAHKSVVIPNGSSLRLGEAKTREPFFLFVGKRRGYKNFLPVVRSLLGDPRFEKYRIEVVGGESPLSAEELSLGRRVQFLGLLPPDQVQQKMGMASLLLFPSLYEGFGMPVLEAFEMGLPVLAMRSSSIPEIVGEEYPLADPEDAASVGAVAYKLLSEWDKWVACGNGRKRLFTVENMACNMVDYYRALLGDHDHIQR